MGTRRPDMPRPETQLSIASLPAWAFLNEISFVDVQVRSRGRKGYGLVCDRKLTTQQDTFDLPTLITVPRGLVLNASSVEDYAKEDRNFRQLVDAAGKKSSRADVLLFLLVQTALASAKGGPSPAGISTPWTGYLQFLSWNLSVPARWDEDDRKLLAGTSLESAVEAKLRALADEFECIREAASTLPAWEHLLGPAGSAALHDWIALDALYWSRCLDLPKSGVSMVPCIDMVNHARRPSAYYEENGKNEAMLLLAPGVDMQEDDEVTISYGADKSAAEMLFVYGFIDCEDGSTTAPAPASRAVFPIAPLPDDPLGRAKTAAFGTAPSVTVHRAGPTAAEWTAEWTSPFAHLMCVNEEDGLGFRVRQNTDGTRQLRVFWRDEDVTDRAADFEGLTRHLPDLRAVLRLRVVTVVQELCRTQLARMRALGTGPGVGPGDGDGGPGEYAWRLRCAESRLLDMAVETMEREVSG